MIKFIGAVSLLKKGVGLILKDKNKLTEFKF